MEMSVKEALEKALCLNKDKLIRAEELKKAGIEVNDFEELKNTSIKEQHVVKYIADVLCSYPSLIHELASSKAKRVVLSTSHGNTKPVIYTENTSVATIFLNN